MNVLMFVMTMLMILALLTYARLDAIRSLVSTQKEFERYMEGSERKFLNEKAQERYDMTVVSNRAASTGQPGNPNKPTGASPRLSWSFLTNKNPNELAAQSQKQLSKELIQILFGQQSFYIEAIKERPNIIEELFEVLPRVIDQLPKEEKIKSANDLANLDLGDKMLNAFFYKLLKGFPKASTTHSTEEAESSILNEQSKDNGEDEVEVQDSFQEHQAEENEVSLLDYITIKASNKIRVYLAPPALLLAIYKDQGVVQEIVRERQNLYREIRQGKLENAQATEQFKNNFSRRSTPYGDMLDFTVSKVKPDIF
jgi:hypothetical protein